MNIKKFILIITIFLSANPVYSEVAELTFEDLNKQSDLIIEGRVLNQKDVSLKYEGFIFKKLSIVTLDRVLKGIPDTSGVIYVYTGLDFVCDVSGLEENKRYILFLKKYADGYMDTNYGRGTYRMDQVGVTEITGISFPKFKVFKSQSQDKGEDYYEFLNKIINIKLAENKEYQCGSDSDCIPVFKYEIPHGVEHPAKTLLMCQHREKSLTEDEWRMTGEEEQSYGMKCVCDRKSNYCQMEK